MYYRIDQNNNIIDCSNIKYADECLFTEKKIVKGFNGKLYFEEYIKTDEYLREYQNHIKNQNIINEINNIKNWFDIDYMRLEQKFRRLHTLGKTTDSGKNAYDELIQLYNLAEQYRQRIQELEALVEYK